MEITSEHRPRAEACAFAGDVPLVAVRRGEEIGSVHRGIIAVTDVRGAVLFHQGDVDQGAFLRSAAKPFQVMPAVLSGAIERFAITERELAVLCASHNAEPRHMEAVLSVLDKIGLDDAALQCGIHPPLHEETARRRWEAHIEPTPVCNNCSGAHTGMLAACRANNWSIEDYTDPAHPLQVQTREIVAAFAELPVEAVHFAVDNCAVPTFHLPLRHGAQAFARLGSGEGVSPELSAAARRVVHSMTSFPEMIGGEDRFDTDLMLAAPGRFVAKSGAEGFLGIGLRESESGLALKVTDGNSRAIPPAAIQALNRLGALRAEELDRLSGYARPELFNLQGRQVGSLVTLFDGDGS